MYKMCNDVETREDLFHDILLQMENNHKFQQLDDKQKTYFFIGIVRRQVYSTNSSYYRTYKKYSMTELKEIPDVPDEEYQESMDIEWIKNILEEEVKKDKEFWYDKKMFEIYLENKGIIERVYKQTRIPRYSIIESVDRTKKLINQRWTEKLDN